MAPQPRLYKRKEFSSQLGRGDSAAEDYGVGLEAGGQGVGHPGERPDASRPQVRAEFVLQPGFEDRRLPRAQDGQLLRGDLAEPDVVAPTGKTGRGHASHIPGAEDSYAHTDRLKPEHPKPQGQAGRAFSCPRRRGAGPWFGVGSYEMSRDYVKV